MIDGLVKELFCLRDEASFCGIRIEGPAVAVHGFLQNFNKRAVFRGLRRNNDACDHDPGTQELVGIFLELLECDISVDPLQRFPRKCRGTAAYPRHH